MLPFFSIIITTYNRSIQLKNCIDSILAQTNKDFELIVVDDCSSDDTINMISKYKNHVRLFSTVTNSGGPATPRNIGMKAASGKWLCFCDSDDAFTKSHLETYKSFILQSGLDDGIISSNALLVNNAGVTTDTYFNAKNATFKEISFTQNWNKSHLILSSVCIRNKNLVPFREEKLYHSIEDYIFLLENMIRGKKHYFTGMPTVLYNHQSPDSIRSVKGNGNRVFFYKKKIFDEYCLRKIKNSLILKSIIWRDQIKFLVRTCISFGK